MAQKRMFSQKITETDSFLDMPASTQNLYFHINMNADDEGFVSNANTVRRMVGAGEDDLRLLVAKKYLLQFETGIVVVRDWRIHNYVRGDRFKPTIHNAERSQLVADENGRYDFGMTNDIPNDNQVVDSRDTQYRLGKDRLDKISNNMSGSDDQDDQVSKLENIEPSFKYPFAEIVEHLNLKANKKFKSSSQKTQQLIKARFADGYTVDDFKHAIDVMTVSWRNNVKMVQYLRPETLFGTKFESYVNKSMAEAQAEDKLNLQATQPQSRRQQKVEAQPDYSQPTSDTFDTSRLSNIISEMGRR